ncbi:antibiotic biosynthesis monooxygenase [Hymenobacter sp. GOD-10R]|uniref:putative quinol monooxygenase n=1 Tax=Hymenobacter sp. GOD-10R TaxID=3093922 RepID=UPI002D78E3EF|nr:antibiotic biosynthesis monooxygenase [Hymenobacter sp. GOD-10R]WRQ30657.1 antibiotic biosynthesis monooxygenase [Hymenobacter sp. GOD-10R]
MLTKQHPSAGPAATEAQPAAGESALAQLTSYRVKPTHQAAFRQALSEYVTSALNLPGNIMAEAYTELDKPDVFWLIERWRDQAQREDYQKSYPATAVARLAEEALAAPAELLLVHDLEPLSKEDWLRAPAASDQPLTVMLFVDAVAGTGPEFRRRYHAAMPQIRQEAGIVTYQLTQVQGSEGKFITYEKFRNAQALQDHLKFSFVGPILDFLHTSITNPPFE